jgi:hypothetical protein
MKYCIPRAKFFFLSFLQDRSLDQKERSCGGGGGGGGTAGAGLSLKRALFSGVQGVRSAREAGSSLPSLLPSPWSRFPKINKSPGRILSRGHLGTLLCFFCALFFGVGSRWICALRRSRTQAVLCGDGRFVYCVVVFSRKKKSSGWPKATGGFV